MTLRIGLAACVFRSVEMLSVARHSGFDFLVADMEHGAMSLGEAAALCVAGIEAGYPVQVRVPGPTSDYSPAPSIAVRAGSSCRMWTARGSLRPW